MIRAFIVDDEKVIRDGLTKMIVNACPGVSVVGSATNGHAALAELRRLKPDICLVDMKMPIMDGAEMIRQVRQEDTHVRFVVISGYAEFEYARKLIGYGCSAYLFKPVKISELAQVVLAIRDELDGQAPQPIDEDTLESTSERYIIRQALQYIRNNYQTNLSLSDVAEAVHMNSSYFCQLFKKETSVTFLTYLTNYRIECAKELLSSSNFRIAEIGAMVGIADSKYFSKVFRKVTGTTPAAWREKKGEDQ